MDCDLFLDGYSDYRDELLTPPERVAFDAHLRACASCARYDRVVSKGVRVLHDEAPLQVSEDFMARLQHRIYNEDEARSPLARRARNRAVAGGLAAAAALGAVAVVPLTQGGAADTAQAPAPRPEAQSLAAMEAEDAATGLGARLEQVGVQVYPMPYRDVLYRTASATSQAVHAAGAARATQAR